MKRILLSVALVLTCASTSHAAMRLSTNGMGQVLLFPYYTVQGGQSTLVTLVNTTDRAKVLDVRFNEALNGSMALGARVYLGPHDTWVAAVFASGINGVANLITDDRSCVRYVDDQTSGLPNGHVYHRFQARYSTDGGPTTVNRTREGSLDVVELAQIERGSTLEAALTSASGQPDCTAAANHDLMSMMDAPGGGVYGAFAIVDAAQGTVMAGQPTAVDGFSTEPVLFQNGHSEVLDRGDTSTDPSEQYTEALVPVENRVMSIRYRRPIDALTALLMTDTLYGDFMKDPSAGADTDWVIAAPTKRFYAGNLPTGIPGMETATPPWRYRFSEHGLGYSCMPYDLALHDREQRTIQVFPELVGTPPPNHRYLYNLCFAVDVLRFNARGNDMLPDEVPSAPSGPNPVSPALASRISAPAASIDDAVVKFGVARLSLATGDDPARLRVGPGTPTLRGLPVIGFEATKYVSGAIGGVLANYTYAVPLRGRAACANEAGAEIGCP